MKKSRTQQTNFLVNPPYIGGEKNGGCILWKGKTNRDFIQIFIRFHKLIFVGIFLVVKFCKTAKNILNWKLINLKNIPICK